MWQGSGAAAEAASGLFPDTRAEAPHGREPRPATGNHAAADAPPRRAPATLGAMGHLWFAIRWLHLLAMAFFVGGQMMLAAVVVPVARRAGERESLRALARRFGYGTLAALGVLLASGIAMAFHEHLWSDGTLQLKLGLVALLGGLLLVHVRRPERHAIEAIVFVLSLAVVWIGLYLANGYS
jgi:hypothetical protein